MEEINATSRSNAKGDHMENKPASDRQVRLNTTSAFQSKVRAEAMMEKTARVSCVYFFFTTRVRRNDSKRFEVQP